MASSIETSFTGEIFDEKTSLKLTIRLSMTTACWPQSDQLVSLLGGLMRLGAQTMARLREVMPVVFLWSER